LRFSHEPLAKKDSEAHLVINDPPPPRRQEPPEESHTVLAGTVHRYFADVKLGSIKSDSGRLYSFRIANWVSTENSPVPGIRVIFELEGICAVRIQAEEYQKKTG
jgi:hypothetical protein